MGILGKLILLVHEYKTSFIPVCVLHQCLIISILQDFLSLFKFIPRYFICIAAVVSGIVLISLSEREISLHFYTNYLATLPNLVVLTVLGGIFIHSLNIYNLYNIQMHIKS